jgi:hypothetical protein
MTPDKIAQIANIVLLIIVILGVIATIIWIRWDKKRVEHLINDPLPPEDPDEEWYVPKDGK